MNWNKSLLVVALVLTGVLAASTTTKAQSIGLGISATPGSVLVGDPILYSLQITNFNLITPANDVYLTNDFTGFVNFNDWTNDSFLSVTAITNSSQVIFYIPTLPGGSVVQLTLTVSALTGGLLTNQVTFAALNRTNMTTNVITTVTPPVADLAVGMTNVTSGILTNDTTMIGLFVTNLGPNLATGVTVTNTLPSSFKLLSVSPAAFSNSFAGGNLALSPGVMTSGSATQILVTVQPTNSGTFNLGATVASAGVLDTNPANNTVTNSLSVAGGLAGNLTVTVQGQQFNRQTGLLDMNVLLRNNAATNVPAARINVSGLTGGTWLYNAAGTNSAVPYVLYNTNLPGGASVPLVLEYYVLLRGPLTNYLLDAIPVPAINLAAPTNSGVVITNYGLSSGGYLIEFAATPGRTYTIVYASDVSFSNALMAQPSIVAPADRVQWIDNGPPKTVSHPSLTGSRFYKVFQSQ